MNLLALSRRCAEPERLRIAAILRAGRRFEVQAAADYLATKTCCTPDVALAHLTYAQRTVAQIIQRSKL